MQKYEEMLSFGDLLFLLVAASAAAFDKAVHVTSKGRDFLAAHVEAVASNTEQLDKHKKWGSQKDLSLSHCSGRKIYQACDRQGDTGERRGDRALVVS